LPDFR